MRHLPSCRHCRAAAAAIAWAVVSYGVCEAGLGFVGKHWRWRTSAHTSSAAVRLARAPKWLSELDNLGLVDSADSTMYRQFIDTAVKNKNLAEAKSWAQQAAAQNSFSAEDLEDLCTKTRKHSPEVAKLWLEVGLEEFSSQAQSVCRQAFEIMVLTEGFAAARSWLEQNGVEASVWMQSQGDVLLSLLRQQGGDLLKAGKILEEALEAGVSPDHSIYKYLLYEAIRVSDFTYISRWFDSALEYGIMPGAPIINNIIGEAAKLNGLAAAEEWFYTATRLGFQANVYTYKYLIQAATQDSDPHAPERWFHRSIEAGVEPDIVTFNTLINAAAKAGDLPAAESWFEMAISFGVRPQVRTYNMLLAAAAKAGEIFAAEHWFTRLSEDGLDPDNVSFNSYMKALMKSARTQEVEELFWKMKASGVDPDDCTVSTLHWALGRQRTSALLKDADLLKDYSSLEATDPGERTAALA
eukprot:TRINITY_DN60974_c0_g1_i1.p1 TRINITY_DN60974_c0_g1~~TRINITY_DN60974_c0_g1_i1.p1  ORF type:complete len:468 (+),score=125.87 TRINITY_DN60974_c0_g1_i1:35-1438(+)